MDMMLSPKFLSDRVQALRLRMDNHTDEDIQQAIVSGMIKDQLLPSHPRYEEHPDIDENKITATLDFILDENDELLFLEGGPGHLFNPHWGGNPCCFEAGNIDGIALKSHK